MNRLRRRSTRLRGVGMVIALVGIAGFPQKALAVGAGESHDICEYGIEMAFSPPLSIWSVSNGTLGNSYLIGGCAGGDEEANTNSVWPPNVSQSNHAYNPPSYTVNTSYSGNILLANTSAGFWGGLQGLLIGGTVAVGFPPSGSGTTAWSELSVLDGGVWFSADVTVNMDWASITYARGLGVAFLESSWTY